ncbi:hypothetical protein CLJ1_5419 [Pseudomonas paraeruginosa]|nr:hypothetical protein CLJ1_5419 [Pseudomonas aeruginosa]
MTFHARLIPGTERGGGLDPFRWGAGKGCMMPIGLTSNSVSARQAPS